MVIGITGRAGVGKSYLSAHLPASQYTCLELDIVGHEVLRLPAIIDQIITLFGPDMCRDGQIDRQLLGGLVFGDAAALHQLNRLVHPYINTYVREFSYSRLTHFVIVGALIDQIGLADFCDCMIHIDAEDHDLYESGSNPDRLRAIHGHQISRSDYHAQADHTFLNTFSTNTRDDWLRFFSDQINNQV